MNKMKEMKEKKSKRYVQGSMKFSLYKLGNSPYYYYYYTLNKIKYEGSTGSSNEDTSIEFTRKHYEETKTGNINHKSKKTLFKTICDKYLDYQQKKENLSPDYRKTIMTEINYLKECFGNNNVEDICNVNKMIEYIDFRKNYHLCHKQKKDKNGRVVRKYRPIGSSSINMSLSFFKMVLKYSQQPEQDHLKGKIIPSIKDLKELENTRNRLLTDVEISTLEKYWTERDIYRWYVLKLMLETGIRPKEHLKILHKDLHLSKNYLMLNDRKNVRGKRPQLDSTIPLSPEIKSIIETLIKRPHLPTDPVFTDKNGKVIRFINFKKSLIDCGIDPTGLCLYSLRHFFVSKMIKTQIPLPILSSICGHRNTLTLQRFYAHFKEKGDPEVISQFLNNKK